MPQLNQQCRAKSREDEWFELCICKLSAAIRICSCEIWLPDRRPPYISLGPSLPSITMTTFAVSNLVELVLSFPEKKKKKAQTADLHNTVDIIFWGDKMLGTFDDEGSVRACRHMCDNRYIDIHGKRAACLFILRPPWVQCAVCTAGHDSAVFTELWRVQITNANETDYPSSSSPATPPPPPPPLPHHFSLSLSLSLSLSRPKHSHTLSVLYIAVPAFFRSEGKRGSERAERVKERERELI